jgi:hypothetical protein
MATQSYDELDSVSDYYHIARIHALKIAMLLCTYQAFFLRWLSCKAACSNSLNSNICATPLSMVHCSVGTRTQLPQFFEIIIFYSLLQEPTTHDHLNSAITQEGDVHKKIAKNHKEKDCNLDLQFYP